MTTVHFHSHWCMRVPGDDLKMDISRRDWWNEVMWYNSVTISVSSKFLSKQNITGSFSYVYFGYRRMVGSYNHAVW